MASYSFINCCLHMDYFNTFIIITKVSYYYSSSFDYLFKHLIIIINIIIKETIIIVVHTFHLYFQ